MTPLERLFALEQFGIKLGLDNIGALLQALDHPERSWPSVHIAGTNGKGSVAAMVERGLRAAGLRTGRYTSPHLARIEERAAIDGAAVDSDTFAAVTSDVMEVVDRCRQTGALTVSPTFFEVSTAVAFEVFRRRSVDVAVVEVGLGGRFDATNVLSPVVSAIVSIAFDHERHLGTTLGAIAGEKAGIAKRGVPLVVGRVPAEAHDVIASVARERGARLVDATEGTTLTCTMSRGTATMALTTPTRAYPPAALALAGRHQVDNAVVAVRILEEWSAPAGSITPEAIATGLSACEWPGRLEWLACPDGGRLLIDAAHNPAGAAALADYLRDAGVAPLPIVIAAMQDKDLAGMIGALAPVASCFVATTVPLARARSARMLTAEIARLSPATPVHEEASPDAAVLFALSRHQQAVAAGSILMAGPLRERLLAGGARRV